MRSQFLAENLRAMENQFANQTGDPVLILGAGINGAALARELVLNGVDVVVVDRGDLAAGTTSYSSRLIHGGLRYLEYGDFDLVRESLEERTRWLRLAPHLVRPLRLFIPIRNRFGGLGRAARTFLGKPSRPSAVKQRGLWTIRAGLWLYDHYARDRSLPRSRAYRLHQDQVPPLDEHKYRWVVGFYDAQLRYPERFTLELFCDARDIAKRARTRFQLLTYHRAVGQGRDVEIVASNGNCVTALDPCAIVNATGAWVDHTLEDLGVPSRKLIGGTKGSHFVTFHPRLVHALSGNGVYVEAADGRPVFILPFGGAVLVGTTDEPFEGDPDTARATPAELNYLMRAVEEVFPQFTLTVDDIEMVYSGVRPLPSSGPTTPAAISRRHWLADHAGATIPCYSMVGGKLTTCRSLAETAAHTILKRLGREPQQSSRERPLPGSALSHCGAADEENLLASVNIDASMAQSGALRPESIEAMHTLFGDRLEAILPALVESDLGAPGQAIELLDGTPYPVALARYMIRHEWACRLEDLVERRLMLLYHRPLTRRCLEQLADLLVETSLLDRSQRNDEVSATIVRLGERFNKRIA